MTRLKEEGEALAWLRELAAAREVGGTMADEAGVQDVPDLPDAAAAAG
jgi:hypothetical protein